MMHGYTVDAVADLCGRIGDVGGAEPAVDRSPRRAGVVRAERSRRGDGDVHPFVIDRVDEDGVKAHPARAGLPLGPRAVAAQAREFVPRPPAVSRAEERRVLDSGIYRVGVVGQRFEVPDPFELPGALRAVVELVRREWLAGLWRGVVNELVALALRHSLGSGRRLARRRPRLVPGSAAVVRALNDLAEPAARL